MERFFFVSLIFLVSLGFIGFAQETNETQILQNLEILERLEKSKSDATGRTGGKGSRDEIQRDEDENSENYGKIRELAEKIENEKSQIPDTVIEKTGAGTRISIRNLRFKSDSAALLEVEKNRLDEIARILKSEPSTKILVEGHTASTGDERGEKILSLERARKIAREMAARGVPEGKFECFGFGSERPVAPNDTPQNRAQNRRVEITICAD